MSNIQDKVFDERHSEDANRLSPVSGHDKRKQRLDALWGGGMLASSTVMAAFYTALQPEPSNNTVLKKWQTVSPESEIFTAELLTRDSQGATAQSIRGHGSVSFTIFALSTIGFSASCVVVYRRVPNLLAKISTCCILLVLLESWQNILQVLMVERMLVVMPAVMSGAIFGALVCRTMVRNKVSVSKTCPV